MWIMLYDCFFSIVSKDCAPDELMVRARRPGDIQKVWKDAKITKYDKSDYMFRAAIKRTDIIAALSTEVMDIDYDNFKNEVRDKPLHDAYLSVWTAMARLQPAPPYSGLYKKGRRNAGAIPGHARRGHPVGKHSKKS
jgi:hypothetical protein